MKILLALLLGPKPLEPAHPAFLRMVAVNSIVLLSASSGLAFAVFNTLHIGTADVIPLVAFDLTIFLAAVAVGGYLRRTGDVRRIAVATSAISFLTLLTLLALTAQGDYFIL